MRPNAWQGEVWERERGIVTGAGQREAAAELCSLLMPEAAGHKSTSYQRTSIDSTNSVELSIQYLRLGQK